MRGEAEAVDLRARNRLVLRIVLAGMGLLIIASFMVGIRW
jgi:hypothetical protein